MPAAHRHVTFFHSPQSRSAGVLILLEELGADYELQVLNPKKGEQRGAAAKIDADLLAARNGG